MKLSKYDNKLIRIQDTLDDIYEGIGEYLSREYNEHEYGRDEESLKITYVLFFTSDIKKIEIIKDFSNKYGKLEEVVVDQELDLVEEVFEDGEDIHIIRLIDYIKDNLDLIVDKEKMTKLLDTLMKYNKNSEILKKALELKNKLEELK